MRWKVSALVLGLVAALLWGGQQLSDAAGVEGGILSVVRQVASSALLVLEPVATPRPRPATRALQFANAAPGSIVVSIGPVVSGLAVFPVTGQPVKAAHTFAFGISPVVELHDGLGALQIGDNTTVVGLGIQPGTGAPGATLTCNGGLATMVSAGVATFSGCKIDLNNVNPDAVKSSPDYVLEAFADGIGTGLSAPFPVVWAGDANRDCLEDILDFSVLVRSFGKHPGEAGYDARADLNGDNLVNIVDFSVLVTLFGTRCPSLELLQASGPGGTVVTATGTGYVARRDVAVTLDGVAVITVPGVVTTDGSGGFTASFAVPASTLSGTHVVKASQAGGRVIAAAVFTVP